MAIVPLSAGSTRPANVKEIVAILEPRELIHEDGLLVAPEDWARIVDLARSELSKSELLSVVELPVIGKAEDKLSALAEKLELILIVGYGGESTNPQNQPGGVFFRLIQASSGQVIKASHATGPDLATAIRNALGEIEQVVYRLPWHCTVLATVGDHMLINRGRLDGLQEGTELVGYSMAPESTASMQDSLELRLMQYGQRKGVYRVIELRSGVAKVKPITADIGLLAKGDILEQPEIHIKRRDIPSRGKRAWDDIYEK